MEPVRDSDENIDFSMNRGPGKHYPGGPTCMFNNKLLDCLTFCSERGGITTEILIKVLKHLDEKMSSHTIPSFRWP